MIIITYKSSRKQADCMNILHTDPSVHVINVLIYNERSGFIE